MPIQLVSSHSAYHRAINTSYPDVLVVSFKFLISKQDRSFILFLNPRKVPNYFLLKLNFILGSTDIISDLEISKSNKYLVSGSFNGSIKLFSMDTMTEIYCFSDTTAANSKIMSLHISDDDKEITFTTDNATIGVMNIDFITDPERKFLASKQISRLAPALADTDAILHISDSEKRKEMMKKYQDLQILPYNWNLLHLITLFRYSDISLVPSYSEFKVRFLVDKDNKTPLHYLIEQHEKDFTSANTLLKYILDYLEDRSRSFFEYQKTIESLTTQFDFIIANADPKLISRFLDLCYRNTPAAYGSELPPFGEPINKYISSKTPTLVSKAEKICTLGSDPIAYYTNMLHLDYSLGSEDMLKKVIFLTGIKHEVVFQHPLMHNFVQYLWNKTLYVRWFMGLLFSALMLMLSVYIGLNQRILPLEIFIMIVTWVFLANEFLQMKALGVKYITIPWNWVDIIHLALIISYIITRFIDSDDYFGKAWMSTGIIIAGYLRWISYLRVFKTTRHLIEIITSTIKGTRGFMVILGFITLGFSLIFMEFYRYRQYQEKGYALHLYETYKLLYADADDSSYSLSEKLLLSLILFLFNILLLNMLISIMGNVFQKVQDQYVMIDSLTRLELILEGLITMKTITIPTRKKDQDKGYLVNCIKNDRNVKKSRNEPADSNSRTQAAPSDEVKFLKERVEILITRLCDKEAEINDLKNRASLIELENVGPEETLKRNQVLLAKKMTGFGGRGNGVELTDIAIRGEDCLNFELW